jgi:ATP-binding cassette subfamily F protein uup
MLAESDRPHAAAEQKRAAAERRKQNKPTKLSYKDQRELDQLPTKIESIEELIAQLQEAVAEPEFYSWHHDRVQAKLKDLADAEAQLEHHVERWSELEILQSRLRS